MPMFNDNAVILENCTIVWEGVTRPEQNDGGNTRWNLKVVIHPNSPDLPLLDKLANAELATSEFRGVLPNGGTMPIGRVNPGEFGGGFDGWFCVNASTFRSPEIYDENGQQITNPMQLSNVLYTGQLVDVLVHCSAFNNKSKGVAVRMDGARVRTSANAPRLSIGGTGAMASKAFGAPGGQAPAAPAYAQAPAAPAYAQAPAAPAAPKLVPVSPQAQGAPDPAQWTGWTQEMLIAQGHFALQTAAPAAPATPPAAPAAPQGGYPAQAHNFLPQ